MFQISDYPGLTTGQAMLKYMLANKSRSVDSQYFDVSDYLCIGPWHMMKGRVLGS